MILINGINSKAGGGYSILMNLLESLKDHPNKFIIISPYTNDFFKFESEHIKIIKLPKIVYSSVLMPLVYEFFLDLLVKYYKIQKIFNLGDLIINTKTRQLYLFDWSYAIYDEKYIWNNMDFISWLNRKIKLLLIKKNIKSQRLDVAAQTSVAKKRLIEKFNLDRVQIIPNAVSHQNTTQTDKNKNFELPDKVNLLYLTHYYPHKNIEILLDVAKIFKEKDLPINFVLTIDSSQHKKARKLIKEIEKESLQKYFSVLGYIKHKDVPAIYKQTDGLIMPTYLESFSGTYVEAMFHEKPIFTSDLDFARNLCKESAFYFNPFDPFSIAEVIECSFKDKDRISINEKVILGKKRLNDFDTWSNVTSNILKLLKI